MPHAARDTVNEWVDKAAKLPWWGGIVLAFMAFIMLHPFAIMDVAAAGPVDDYVPFTSKAFWKGVAGTVQYVVPAVMLFVPALASLVSRLVKGSGA